MTTHTNYDGLRVNYNLTLAETDPTGKSGYSEETMVLELDSQDLRGLDTAGNTTGRNAYIPANSVITDAFMVVETAFTSGGSTTLSIGFAEDDGTVIDVDGVDATIAKTAMDADGDVVQCDGDMVGGVVTVGTANAFPYVTVGTGPYTAGVAKVVIKYYTPV
jgi:hypothetical protein